MNEHPFILVLSFLLLCEEEKKEKSIYQEIRKDVLIQIRKSEENNNRTNGSHDLRR